MNYINKFELIKAVVSGNINQRELLSLVNRQKVINTIYKNKSGLNEIGKFIITNEPVEEENWSKIPGKVKDRLLKIYSILIKSPVSVKVFNELIEYNEKYPNVPAICNYIGMAYQNANQKEKFSETLLETVEKFPHYLFGKISLSEYYLNNDEYKKIPDLLGHRFEITQHYPAGIRLFHISEVRGFYYVTGRYFAKAGKMEMAYKSYFLLHDLDMKHLTTEILGQEILNRELNFVRKMFDKHKPKNNGI